MLGQPGLCFRIPRCAEPFGDTHRTLVFKVHVADEGCQAERSESV